MAAFRAAATFLCIVLVALSISGAAGARRLPGVTPHEVAASQTAARELLQAAEPTTPNEPKAPRVNEEGRKWPGEENKDRRKNH